MTNRTALGYPHDLACRDPTAVGVVLGQLSCLHARLTCQHAPMPVRPFPPNPKVSLRETCRLGELGHTGMGVFLHSLTQTYAVLVVYYTSVVGGGKVRGPTFQPPSLPSPPLIPLLSNARGRGRGKRVGGRGKGVVGDCRHRLQARRQVARPTPVLPVQGCGDKPASLVRPARGVASPPHCRAGLGSAAC